MMIIRLQVAMIKTVKGLVMDTVARMLYPVNANTDR